MKTFTLRLTEEQAEALERLAYINDVSKNKYLASLVTERYSQIDKASRIVDGEIILMVSDKQLPETILESEKDHNEKTLIQAYRACMYALEKSVDEEDRKYIEQRLEEITEMIVS